MSEPTNGEIKTALTRETLISASAVAAIIGGVLWLTNQLHAIDSRLQRIEEATLDRWTQTDMKVWAQELQIRNPAIAVPAVTPPHRTAPLAVK